VSGARVVRGALAALALAGAVAFAPRPAARQADAVVVRVGGDLSGRAGQDIHVPVTVDMTGAPGRTLGSYRLRLVYDPSVLSYNGMVPPSGFAEPLFNTDSSGYGVVKFTALRPSGAGGVVTLFVAHFYVITDSVPSAVTLDVQELTQADATFTNLLPMTTIVNGMFCRSLGIWGDVDGDGVSNSRDALVALSVVVGLPVDTTLNPALADVDADGAVTSRDALIILSGAVGLPVTGFRIGLPAAGACATGSATTLVILPDSLELQKGQRVSVLVQARDATGRVVPTGIVSWSSNSTGVASFVNDNNPGIDARDPGLATLTAQLGPGLRATMKVVVIARRRNWYVDVARALNVPTQAGSQALPFAFVGDALYQATDGDTVRVAAGEYDERVSDYVSVVLLGDSLNRPIIDQRGSQVFDPSYRSYPTLSAGSAAAAMEVAHFVVRGGGIYIRGHDITVRDVRAEMLGGTSPALEVSSQAFVPGAPPAGFAAVNGQLFLGQVLVDNVIVEGYQSYGIEIDQADTATVRNSSVGRDNVSTSSCSVYYPGNAGIAIRSVNSSVIRNNDVTNADCAGISDFQQAGRAVISRNRVTGASIAGIAVSAPVVAFDHNMLRSIALGVYQYTNSYGAYVSNYYGVDTVLSMGDSVIGVRSYYAAGLRIDTAIVAIVDSLVADSIGVDSVSGGSGLSFQGRRLMVTNSRISVTRPNGIEALGHGLVFASRGNRILCVHNRGMAVSGCGECSSNNMDSAFSSRDTVIAAGGDLISISEGNYAQIDTAFVDSSSVGNGVYLSNLTRAVVRDSRVAHVSNTGIYAQAMTSLDLRRNTITGSTYAGVYITYPSSAADSATIVGNTIDSSGSAGLWLTQNAAAIVDSNRLTNSAFDGLFFDFDGGARVTFTRIENNRGYGVRNTAISTAPSLANNIIAGNVLGGAANISDSNATMDAANNYWGDSAGPRCSLGVTGCDPATINGDFVATAGIVFTPFLPSPPATPAPSAPASLRIASGVRALRGVGTAALRTAAPPRPQARPRMALRAASPAGPAPAAASARQAAQLPPFPNAWQKGRQPRAPRAARVPRSI
jgi:hypothetical protein